jgi:hypothetical protein
MKGMGCFRRAARQRNALPGVLQMAAVHRKHGELLLDVELHDQMLAVGGKDDALRGFSTRRLGHLHGLAVADREQKNLAARMASGVVRREVRAVHGLYADPLAVGRDRHALGQRRHREVLNRAERLVRHVDERDRVGVARELARVGRQACETDIAHDGPFAVARYIDGVGCHATGQAHAAIGDMPVRDVQHGDALLVAQCNQRMLGVVREAHAGQTLLADLQRIHQRHAVSVDAEHRHAAVDARDERKLSAAVDGDALRMAADLEPANGGRRRLQIDDLDKGIHQQLVGGVVIAGGRADQRHGGVRRDRDRLRRSLDTVLHLDLNLDLRGEVAGVEERERVGLSICRVGIASLDALILAVVARDDPVRGMRGACGECDCQTGERLRAARPARDE